MGKASQPQFCHPRFRVEHRANDVAPLIVDFADFSHVARSQVARAAARLTCVRVVGEIVVAAQDTDEVVDWHSLGRVSETVPTATLRRWSRDACSNRRHMGQDLPRILSGGIGPISPSGAPSDQVSL
jgi:hypothetical protein